tara:strand:+ start:220 stop:393 length:174 start_codon:yes stop_codon:yes gene_type:complete
MNVLKYANNKDKIKLANPKKAFRNRVSKPFGKFPKSLNKPINNILVMSKILCIKVHG